MKQLSFRKYVLTQSAEDSPAGDFIMDAKHPTANLPDATKWEELEDWLNGHSASEGAIDSARIVWQRYLIVRDGVQIDLGNGLTVADLIELLRNEDQTAHVIKYSPSKGSATSRVRGFSKVTIKQGDSAREQPAIMLE
jgi:hypothetical protein